ncbi:MAG: MGH1-like glycoside hydrolase domain-containing protein [Streptosporangiaceae bacterium]
MGAERERVSEFGKLENGLLQAGDWYRWGPYVSERQWGTVREDYSPDGQAWDYLPHDHARSRAYRWGEDGLAGFCDVEQRLCLGLALWNGRDPILKERAFGLTGSQGNHGEDVKEYWWYLDAIPSHAWNRWRYHYPQDAFPYEELIEVNAARNRLQPEYELLDTGVFDGGRYWIVEVAYAKAGPDDLLMSISVTNAGPETETLHVLPTSWFRNTWSWEDDGDKPVLGAAEAAPDGTAAVDLEHPFVGPMELIAGPGPDGTLPTALFCENETNVARLFDAEPATAYPKDGINDHVISGSATVNPAQTGTKCAFWYQVTLAAGASAELRVRLRRRDAAAAAGAPVTTGAVGAAGALGTAGAAGALGAAGAGAAGAPLGAQFGQVLAQRRGEADEFYEELTPREATPDEAMVMRQGFAGLLWSKQFYYYDVARWLDGDPGQPVPPAERLTGRNCKWRNFDAFDIMSMPDKWEYPWFAAWDLAFHCVALAHVDPAFAKYQLILLCREWFQHPNGALPAYEWNFSDVNPPVQAWAALEVFTVDEGRDLDFLSRVFDKLIINFAWWVNLEDQGGKNVYEGGFLGLDNIGPLDRSNLPVGGTLEQSDATGWMGAYSVALGTIATVLNHAGQRPASDLVLKFLEHFAAIRDALDSQGLWDETDGFYYDRLVTPSGTQIPVRVRSMVGIIPVLAAAIVHEHDLDRALVVGKQFADLLGRADLADTARMREQGMMRGPSGDQRLLLSLAGRDRLHRLLTRLFDESEFLSPHGLRALSAYHRDHPYVLSVEGVTASIDYEPAESTTPMFGGNSNWRGPIWFPLNYLVISVLERYHTYFGDQFTCEYPTGSGSHVTLDKVAADLQDRLITIFTRGPDGRRACFGGYELLQSDPAWRDNLVFGEYFHGDNGAALGASHQTGWTGLIADIVRRRYGMVRSISEIITLVEQEHQM